MGTTRKADTTTFSCQFPPVSLSMATRRPTRILPSKPRPTSTMPTPSVPGVAGNLGW
jgi:hypothetical protein